MSYYEVTPNGRGGFNVFEKNDGDGSGCGGFIGVFIAFLLIYVSGGRLLDGYYGQGWRTTFVVVLWIVGIAVATSIVSFILARILGSDFLAGLSGVSFRIAICAVVVLALVMLASLMYGTPVDTDSVITPSDLK